MIKCRLSRPLKSKPILILLTLTNDTNKKRFKLNNYIISELKQTEFFIITSSFQGAQCKVQWENPQNEGCGDQGPFPIPRMGHSVEYDPDDNCGDSTTACNVTTTTCAPITETQPIPNLKIVEAIAKQCAVETDHNSGKNTSKQCKSDL